MNWWKDKKVLVTGGSGFVGTNLCARLSAIGADVFVPRSHMYDFRYLEQAQSCISRQRPEVVVHLAALVGGIGANRRTPAQFAFDNASIGLNVIEASRIHGVDKLICLGTVCSYPKHTPVPFVEESLFAGYPEETNAPYGIARRMLLVHLRAAHQEYGLKGAFPVPTNLYGPHDHFDLRDSHVIPALIRKFASAGDGPVTLWGTGRATRDFLYVDDFVDALLLAGEHCEIPEPINIGSGQEISIDEIANVIASVVGHGNTIQYDSSYPDGQPRRVLDTSKAERLLGWTAKTPLAEGIEKTCAWFLKNHQLPVDTAK